MKINISITVPGEVTEDQAKRLVEHLADYAPASVSLPVERDTFSLDGVTFVSVEQDTPQAG